MRADDRRQQVVDDMHRGTRAEPDAVADSHHVAVGADDRVVAEPRVRPEGRASQDGGPRARMSERATEGRRDAVKRQQQRWPHANVPDG